MKTDPNSRKETSDNRPGEFPLGHNIYQLRRRKRLTQEALAAQLHVSCQAVSKWENSQSVPDAVLLPRIAKTLGTSIDTLMGFIPKHGYVTPYEERYRTGEYYWGIRPNDLAFEVLRCFYPDRPMRLLEVGCGEGRDAVFFARNGFQVTAFDLAESGLEKARQLAARQHVEVNFFRADLQQFRVEEPFDIIYSSGVFHHIPPKLRQEIFSNYKRHILPGGAMAANVFVKKPYIPVPPDSDGDDDTWESGELFRCFSDWKILIGQESEFDCDSGAVPHRHCMNVLIAQKPDQPR